MHATRAVLTRCILQRPGERWIRRADRRCETKEDTDGHGDRRSECERLPVEMDRVEADDSQADNSRAHLHGRRIRRGQCVHAEPCDTDAQRAAGDRQQYTLNQEEANESSAPRAAVDRTVIGIKTSPLPHRPPKPRGMTPMIVYG